MLHGQLRAAFCAGQKNATVHVAFCPPFRSAPEVSAEPIDGPDCRVKIAQVLLHGVRIDVRLATPADRPASVLLEFAAVEPVEPAPQQTPVVSGQSRTDRQ